MTIEGSVYEMFALHSCSLAPASAYGEEAGHARGQEDTNRAIVGIVEKVELNPKVPGRQPSPHGGQLSSEGGGRFPCPEKRAYG